LRLARHGYQVQTLASHTFEEAPVTLKALVNQRSRWMKGWMRLGRQICIFLLKQRVVLNA